MNRIAVLLAMTLTLVGAAHAQTFPSRPVTLIVPWPAGGSTDIGMRALASATEKHLGQPIVIENRPGAGGTVGPANMAANAKPDGYTISQLPISIFRMPYVQKTSFDPAKDSPTSSTWCAPTRPG
jgi:tripartite-type tricarboxylate transporter receptor subunit TctC